MAKGFEYIDREDAIDTLDRAAPEALALLNTVVLDEDEELTVDIFVWGMDGRGVTTTAALNALEHLAATGIVDCSSDGNIQFPPESAT